MAGLDLLTSTRAVYYKLYNTAECYNLLCIFLGIPGQMPILKKYQVDTQIKYIFLHSGGGKIAFPPSSNMLE